MNPPVYNRERTLSAAASYGELPDEVEFVQPADREWYLVSGLKPAEPTEESTNSKREMALKAASPEGWSPHSAFAETACSGI
jgi:hypothetical protein